MRNLGWRWWHTWISFALVLPFLLVCITAILIAHEPRLRWKEIPVAVSWLPGYGGEEGGGPEIRAVHRTADGTDYVATKVGLFTRTDQGLQPVAALGGTEYRDVADLDGRVFVAGKTGLWRHQDGNWTRLMKGEVWSLSLDSPATLVAASKERGILRSADFGATWAADEALHRQAALAAGDAPATTLGNLVVDMHSGRALLGKTWEWLWIDIVSATLVFLVVSGLVMWWRTRRRRILAALRPAGSGTRKMQAGVT